MSFFFPIDLFFKCCLHVTFTIGIIYIASFPVITAVLDVLLDNCFATITAFHNNVDLSPGQSKNMRVRLE